MMFISRRNVLIVTELKKQKIWNNNQIITGNLDFSFLYQNSTYNG